MFLFDNQVASPNLTFKYFTCDDNLLESSESSTDWIIVHTRNNIGTINFKTESSF